MKILIRGPLLSKSGYGEHSRQVFKWALSRGHEIRCQILNWGITSWYLDKDDLNGLVGEIMSRSSNFEETPDLSLQIQLPNEWDPALAKKNIGITAGIETDICSEEWKICCNKMDHVVVPSEFSRSSFLKGDKLKTEITVIPEAYLEDLDADVEQAELEQVKTTFNFLLFGQVTGNNIETDRKNLFNTVKWFCEEFQNDKEVGLIIKSNLGTNCIYHKNGLKNLFKNFVSQVRKGEYPKIYLLNGDMSTKEVAGLLKSKKVKAMLSMTRGEGYGLPLIDAAAAGIPVIATNWSGHLEFLSKGHFTKLEYDLVEVPKEKIDGTIFIEGAKWASVKEEDAKKRIRKTFTSYSKPKEWAENLSKIIRRDFCNEEIFKKYDQLIGNIR